MNALQAENDMLQEEVRRLRRRNKELGALIDSYLDGRDRIARMARVTGLEPDADRAGHGYLSSDGES